MAIYAKITIREKGKEKKREYIALLNSGSSLKPISVDLRILPISYIIIPKEVAIELNINLEDLPRKGKYYVHEGTCEVCMHDPDDEPITCLDIHYIFIEEGLDRIILPAEFLMNAKIKLDMENTKLGTQRKKNKKHIRSQRHKKNQQKTTKIHTILRPSITKLTPTHQSETPGLLTKIDQPILGLNCPPDKLY